MHRWRPKPPLEGKTGIVLLAFFGGLLLLFFLVTSRTSTLDEGAGKAFVSDRLTVVATALSYVNNGYPNTVASLYGFDDEALLGELEEVFPAIVAAGKPVEHTLPGWALAFSLFGESERALSLLDGIENPEPPLLYRITVVRAIIAGETVSPELRSWIDESFANQTSQLTEWHYLAIHDTDPSTRDWLIENGHQIARRGIAAHTLTVTLILFGLIGAVLYLVKRKQTPSPRLPSRVMRSWSSAALVRQFCLAEIIGLTISSLVAIPLFMIGRDDAFLLVCGSISQIFPAIWLVSRFTPGWKSALRLFQIRRPHWPISLLLALAGVSSLVLLVEALFFELIPPSAQLLMLTDSLDPMILDRPLSVIGLLVMAVLIAPFTEEILFRGFLFNGLKKQFGPWGGAILSSLIFALMHLYSPTGAATVFFFGLIMCWFYRRSDSLWPGIIAHMAVNLIATTQAIGWYSLD